MKIFDFDFDIEDYLANDCCGYDNGCGTRNTRTTRGTCGNVEEPIDAGFGCPCPCPCPPFPCPGGCGENKYTLTAGACPETTPLIVMDASANSRIINVPIRIDNFVRNKRYVVFVTVYKMIGCEKIVIGQANRTLYKPGCPGCGDYTFEVPVVIDESVCSAGDIYIDVTGNYVRICEHVE